MPEVNGHKVGPIGYGLMGLTWRAEPLSDEKIAANLKTALENGANLWNGGEFYGPPGYNSMTILEKYFAKYPEDADKVVLHMKGSMGEPPNMRLDGSPTEIRRSIDAMLKQLNGRKKIDIFEPSRRDKSVPYAETLGAIQEYVDKGLVGGIALSEVSAASIHEAVKIAKIVAVEVELSLFSTDVLTNGVAAACAQHNIPLIAYSPLSRGILTGQIKSFDDLPEGDFRRLTPRFQPGNFEINLQLVKQVGELAAKKGVTPAQFAIAWVRSVSKRPGMPVIIPIPGGSSPERVAENTKDVELTPAELEAVEATLAKFEVKGGRYPPGFMTEILEG